jgi:hypothetical protein
MGYLLWKNLYDVRCVARWLSLVTASVYLTCGGHACCRVKEWDETKDWRKTGLLSVIFCGVMVGADCYTMWA